MTLPNEHKLFKSRFFGSFRINKKKKKTQNQSYCESEKILNVALGNSKTL